MSRFVLVILTLTAVATMAFAICSGSSVFHKNLHSEFPAELRLIAVGGMNGGKGIDDVDVITLSSNGHTIAAPLPTDLSNFGSTIVNDTIYVVGGSSGDYQLYQSSFLAYNVAANAWTKLPDFPFNISANALVAVGNAIYSIGGYAQNYGYMNYTYKYDLNERVWSKLPALLPVITLGPCVVADSSNNIYYLHSGDLYRTSDGANTWTKLSSMIVNHNSASCVLLPKKRSPKKSQQILVAGGSFSSVDQIVMNSVELYDIATDTWKSAESMNRARDMASAVVVPGSNNDAIICGGANGDETYDDCELYSAAKNQWDVLNIKLNAPRYWYGLFVTQV